MCKWGVAVQKQLWGIQHVNVNFEQCHDGFIQKDKGDGIDKGILHQTTTIHAMDRR